MHTSFSIHAVQTFKKRVYAFQGLYVILAAHTWTLCGACNINAFRTLACYLRPDAPAAHVVQLLAVPADAVPGSHCKQLVDPVFPGDPVLGGA